MNGSNFYKNNPDVLKQELERCEIEGCGPDCRVQEAARGEAMNEREKCPTCGSPDKKQTLGLCAVVGRFPDHWHDAPQPAAPTPASEGPADERALAKMIIAEMDQLDADKCQYPESHYNCYMISMQRLVEAARAALGTPGAGK